ncbi:biofilm development regulator YmgB/AriR family protein [Pantoea agglomerans]|uniref:biofilm development regulator YmgB/AriR family protein n=1 Tax=Enterobacter agglomerans TaxID=549 RepID=UPI0032099D6F
MAFAFTAPLKGMNRREQEMMKIMADTNTVAHIRAYLLSTGHRFTGESEAFEAVIRALYSEGRQVSNQAIILRLRDEQASASDKNRQATLLSLLQLVAGYTPHDPHT